MRHGLTGLLFCLLTSTLVAGCGVNENVHLEHATIDDAVSSITVDVGSGDVRLRGSDVSAVSVTARIEGDPNHLGQALDNGQLTLFDDCHQTHCSVDVTAVVPAGVPVDVHTGSGDVRIDDLLATILVRTGSGDIAGAGIAGADLETETGSGDIALDVAEPAERLELRTGSGDVSLGVPSAAYSLSITTGSGDRHVNGVTNDSGAPGSIDVFTGSGDVVIRGY
jgi:hypothetical protein